MSRIWRLAAPVAVAGGLIAAGVLPAQAAGAAAAQPAATPTVTISAKTFFKPVTHDVFVQYKAGKAAVASFKGTVSGATSGQVAKLYAQPFPFKAAAAPVPGQQLALNPVGSTPIPYNFTADPILATKYTVRILPNSTSTTPVASSPVQIVYVVTNQTSFGFKPTCGRPVCHEKVRIYTRMPGLGIRAGERQEDLLLLRAEAVPYRQA